MIRPYFSGFASPVPLPVSAPATIFFVGHKNAKQVLYVIWESPRTQKTVFYHPGGHGTGDFGKTRWEMAYMDRPIRFAVFFCISNYVPIFF